MSGGLRIEQLSLRIDAATPLRHCSLQVRPGEVVGLVGESGSGKSLTALACLGLTPPQARLDGRILIGSTDVLGAGEAELRRIRGKRVAMIFQNPLSALHPFLSIGQQLMRVVSLHFKAPRTALQGRVVQALERVQLGSAFLARYPHQLSGGQLQRVMIAMALACEPEVLIADEPTTALDVTVQARIMALLQNLAGQGMGLLLISHDLALVSEVAQRVYVMYGGRTVESGSTRDLMRVPSHPYTTALLKAQPRLGQTLRRLPVIEGQVLPATEAAPGCVFHARCKRAAPSCTQALPPTLQLRAGSLVECHYPILPGLQEQAQEPQHA